MKLPLAAVYLGVCLTPLLVTLRSASAESQEDIASYCKAMCSLGRGGNLCRCNVVHFAGKRARLDSFLSKKVFTPVSHRAMMIDPRNSASRASRKRRDLD